MTNDQELQLAIALKKEFDIGWLTPDSESRPEWQQAEDGEVAFAIHRILSKLPLEPKA